jgi:microcompartment protein CcmL/EutN
MEKAKSTAAKSAVKETVIASPAEGTEKLLRRKNEAEPDPRHIVQWGDEKNTLPYYLL